MNNSVIDVTKEQFSHILKRGETHFSDFKSKNISPGKLTRTLSAVANADGGELYIGVEDCGGGSFSWSGFSSMEDANGHIQALEATFPLNLSFRYTFWRSDSYAGLVLHCDI